MKNMRNEILEVLTKHSNLRAKEIANYIGVHHFKIMDHLRHMCDEGVIKITSHMDTIHGSVEYYKTYSLF